MVWMFQRVEAKGGDRQIPQIVEEEGGDRSAISVGNGNGANVELIRGKGDREVIGEEHGNPAGILGEPQVGESPIPNSGGAMLPRKHPLAKTRRLRR